MTWAIGAVSLIGYGVLVSDVQVTWKHTAKELPILQKAYPVGNMIVAGFAGSVRIGFRLIESLRIGMSGVPTNKAWHPWWVAKHWPAEASRIFEQSEPEERALKSEVLLVGTSPTEQWQHFPKVYLIRMSSPDFRPQFLTRPLSVWSIGSGTGATHYMSELADALDIRSGIVAFEQAPGGWAAAIAHAMDHAILQSPMVGISHHLQIHIARREGISVSNNDERRFDSVGNESVRQMPALADTWASFENLAAANGVAAAQAIC